MAGGDNGVLFGDDKGSKIVVHKAGAYMHKKLLLLDLL